MVKWNQTCEQRQVASASPECAGSGQGDAGDMTGGIVDVNDAEQWRDNVSNTMWCEDNVEGVMQWLTDVNAVACLQSQYSDFSDFSDFG